MIGYFLLVHRYPAQFKRLFKAIYLPGNQYVVHVDKRSGAALAKEISEFLEPFEGAEILEAKNALWGGYSLVDAELRGMARLLQMDSRWTHYINLSGQDFPIKSQNYIRQFFAANPGKQFIRALDQRAERPDTLNRISHLFVEERDRMIATGIARPFLEGDTPYIGTQWKAVTRSFCDFVCHDPQTQRFKQFYGNSFIADEALFQTVMMNCGKHGTVMNDDLRMIDWVPDGDIKLRPRNFDMGDFDQLRRSPSLFARKFDAEDDSALLSALERHLKTPAANRYRPAARAISRAVGSPASFPGAATAAPAVQAGPVIENVAF
ncbi:beta-1,6-N-acetylglucosaminyltransferase [Novosphingobium resinovorum]|uniref:beta-1,6-N-acetylglucosaminyltransferase n=1 Tax=Novosphingobium resinovorum TaxID=158500 RepID=UPI002ED52C81|nr:beta-1,6-N-acetylglucosaminyltransferase [Novosphingobium resinovorum]